MRRRSALVRNISFNFSKRGTTFPRDFAAAGVCPDFFRFNLGSFNGNTNGCFFASRVCGIVAYVKI
jgi:hypothetical protein